MQALAQLLATDPVTCGVAVVLLLMSLCSWVLIVWKTWLLRRAHSGLQRSTTAFWQASTWEQAHSQVQAFDSQGIVLPLIIAAYQQQQATTTPAQTAPATTTAEAIATEARSAASTPLVQRGSTAQQLTRVLRDALQTALYQLQTGQILLASIGATAPFVGLLGTVWGIYHTLLSLAASGQASIDKIAGPVAQTLVMTAAGLVVAIPAVLGYNLLGRVISRIEAQLEGFAFDLHALLTPAPVSTLTPTRAPNPIPSA